MRKWRRWFLPSAPDLLAELSRQGGVSLEAVDAFRDWANGNRAAASRVHTLEHESDAVRRGVQSAVRRAFVTPIGPEDIYELSERLDGVVHAAKDLVREAEVLEMLPDPAMGDMADLIALGVRNLVNAFPDLVTDPDRATEQADTAVDHQRRLEHVYRSAMSSLVADSDFREVTGRRELYRRCVRIGDAIVGVGHRIWYAVVKEG
jgi:uncharacterized protein Yka (UPF0111/DUF47 family)